VNVINADAYEKRSENSNAESTKILSNR